MTLPYILGLVVAVLGPSGLVFGALRYNRDEAGKVVAQQAEVLVGMRQLLSDQRISVDRLKEERDKLAAQVGGLQIAVDALNLRVKELTAIRGGADV